MTIRDISIVTGASKRTIQRKAKQMFPDNIGGNLKSEFSESQALAIIGELRFKAKQSANMRQSVAESAPISRSEIQTIISETVAETLRQVMPYIQTQHQSRSLQIESKFTTALAYCKQNGLSCDFDYVKSIGYKAAVYSRMHGLAVQKIPDPRYGFVNGYTVAALEAAV